MKLARIADMRFHAALDKLAASTLPIKVAFKLKGVIKTVREEYQKYEEVRNNLLKKFGKKDEAGNLLLNDKQSVEFEPDSLQEFVKEMGELANLEVSIPTISLSDLGNEINLTFQDVEALEGLIVED